MLETRNYCSVMRPIIAHETTA